MLGSSSLCDRSTAIRLRPVRAGVARVKPTVPLVRHVTPGLKVCIVRAIVIVIVVGFGRGVRVDGVAVGLERASHAPAATALVLLPLPLENLGVVSLGEQLLEQLADIRVGRVRLAHTHRYKTVIVPEKIGNSMHLLPTHGIQLPYLGVPMLRAERLRNVRDELFIGLHGAPVQQDLHVGAGFGPVPDDGDHLGLLLVLPDRSCRGVRLGERVLRPGAALVLPEGSGPAPLLVGLVGAEVASRVERVVSRVAAVSVAAALVNTLGVRCRVLSRPGCGENKIREEVLQG